MRWYHYVAVFFCGAFLANSVPHFVAGISGMPFQSPFAHPPGQGLSPSLTNALWGFVNLIVGYVLWRAGKLDLRQTRAAIVFFAGVLLMAIQLATWFGRFHGGNI
jgi:hypothetical protein